MTWGHAAHVARRVTSVIASPVFYLRSLLGAISGRAKRMRQTERQAALLLSRREVLASEAKRARRQHRKVKATYSAARAVTHGILARGVSNG